MNIFVCIGSSCHLKGSYDVIKKLEEIIKEKNLEDKITIKASFCLNHCSTGVTMKANEQYIDGVSPENIEEKFEKEILPLLG